MDINEIELSPCPFCGGEAGLEVYCDPEGREAMGKTSNISKTKYNAKTYDQVKFVVKKGQRDIIKTHAERKGISLNSYINELIKKDMESI